MNKTETDKKMRADNPRTPFNTNNNNKYYHTSCTVIVYRAVEMAFMMMS